MIFCVHCNKFKPASAFNRTGEHILPLGFGNDGKTEAVLKDTICLCCNKNFGDIIDKPFIRYVTSRKIATSYGMKRRKKRNNLVVTGSGIVVEYKTSIVHLIECIKIAYETHIKFLNEGYRDETFFTLQKLLSDLISDYYLLRNALKGKTSHRITLEQIWADAIPISKYFDVIYENVFRLDRVVTNSDDIIAEVTSRSKKGNYASLIQLGCWNFGIAVMVCLQSLPPLVIRVSNEVDKYISEFGRDCVHIMDLRSTDKWVGSENPQTDLPILPLTN